MLEIYLTRELFTDTRQSIPQLVEIDENRIEQYSAAHTVLGCQQYCSVLIATLHSG